MATDHSSYFGPSDFLAVAIPLEDTDAYLIGGQALNLWAEILYHRVPEELDEYAPFTSKDVDYYGSRSAAEELARALGGRVLIPKIGDQTPQTALVELELSGRKLEIDFLNFVMGVPFTSAKSKCETLVLPFSDEGIEKEIRVSLLGPVAVLQSRAANVIRLERHDDSTLRQLRAAIVVVREFILMLVEEGKQRQANIHVRQLTSWLRKTDAKKIARNFSIDPTAAFSGIVGAEGWDSRYRAKTLEPELARIERRYAKLL